LKRVGETSAGYWEIIGWKINQEKRGFEWKIKWQRKNK
jgi:hypothetical protein